MNELPKQRPYTIYEAFEEERAAKEEERAAKEKAQQFLKDYRNKEAESRYGIFSCRYLFRIM